MPPGGLKTRNRGCFYMYLILYKKNGELNYTTGFKDNWKDALVNFMRDICGQENEGTTKLFERSINLLTPAEAIQLMYLINVPDVTIVGMFSDACEIGCGQNPDKS